MPTVGWVLCLLVCLSLVGCRHRTPLAIPASATVSASDLRIEWTSLSRSVSATRGKRGPTTAVITLEARLLPADTTVIGTADPIFVTRQTDVTPPADPRLKRIAEALDLHSPHTGRVYRYNPHEESSPPPGITLRWSQPAAARRIVHLRGYWPVVICTHRQTVDILLTAGAGEHPLLEGLRVRLPDEANGNRFTLTTIASHHPANSTLPEGPIVLSVTLLDAAGTPIQTGRLERSPQVGFQHRTDRFDVTLDSKVNQTPHTVRFVVATEGQRERVAFELHDTPLP